MRRSLAPLVLSLALAGPVAAQGEDETAEGFDLLREGSRMILEGLLEELRPMMDEARPFFEDEMLPFLERLGSLIDDLSAYEQPERLPNGDIIIRRAPDRPLPAPDAPDGDMPEVGEDGAVEL
ncbi:MAG: AAA+ family ATPase [Roseicyclus sp.]